MLQAVVIFDAVALFNTAALTCIFVLLPTVRLSCYSHMDQDSFTGLRWSHD